jgi:hypothetical protein
MLPLTWVLQAAVLSSMQFTYRTPGHLPPSCVASTPATLQIFSIKLAEVAGGLQWPLSVYGVVAVRDVVDHNRNIVFSCDRNNSQQLTQNVCIFFFLWIACLHELLINGVLPLMLAGSFSALDWPFSCCCIYRHGQL